MMMDRLHGEWQFHWYSEHLHFQITLSANGEAANTGIPFPLPPTEETAGLVARRAAFIQHRYGVPFLLENPVHYLPDLPADPEIGDEFGLMERITVLSECGQLLDLHNLYCNAINFGFDPIQVLNRIRLDRVDEVHVAGGSWRDGFYMDAHDGLVPEPVRDLLELTLSHAPWIPGVVFEILDEYLDRLGPDGIARELERARIHMAASSSSGRGRGVTGSLADFQSRLGRALMGEDTCPVDPHSAGFRFTMTVRCSWCEGRATMAARAVLTVLPGADRRRLASDYVDQGGGLALFWRRRAKRFSRS